MMTHYRMAGYAVDTEFEDNLLVATHPAQNGTFIVFAEDAGPHQVPVVLWGVLMDGMAVPITTSGVWHGVNNQNMFVLHPTGHCSKFEESWDTLEHALEAHQDVAP